MTQGRDFSSYGEVDGVDYTVGSTAPYSWDVVRDNAGRITQRVENIGADTVTWDYTYDLMGRLETVYKDNGLAEKYSYDGQGNRIEETNILRGMSKSYTHTNEDQIVFAGVDFYTYDVDGFLTSRRIASGTNSGVTTVYYSSRGELLSATLPDSTVISYVHDPMGKRVAKRVNGTITERYLWQDATTLLAVLDAAENPIQRFEYAHSRMPVAMTQVGQVYYLAYDQVGSLRVVTDSAGTVVKQVDYDSFGNVLNDSNPLFSIPFGFAGGLHDRDTGLVRFGARDYDPATGKWTAKDPIDFAGGDLNLMNYCLGDPINFFDMLGYFSYYNAALTFEGTPYKYGGIDKNGIDCSGLVIASVGETNHDVWWTGKKNLPGNWDNVQISTMSDLQVGDVLVWRYAGHAAYYAGGSSLFHAHGKKGTPTGFTPDLFSYYLPEHGLPYVYRQRFDGWPEYWNLQNYNLNMSDEKNDEVPCP